MTPNEILEGCQRDGISLSVTVDRNLAFEGESYALAFWLPHLRKHKSENIDALTPTQPEIRRCQDCKHFATPGLSDGYCGQREDLPAAYGINHPLRRLPADNGESCNEYSACDWLQP